MNFCIPEGKAAANTYESKYAEVSAAIDHKTDELLVGILKQIRLLQAKKRKAMSKWCASRRPETDDSGCLMKARENVLAKLLKGDTGAGKWRSCNDLYVL